MPYQVVQPWIRWKIRTTEGESVMGNIGIKINGEWVDLMSAFVPCQLCNEPVQIRDLEDISSDSVNGVVTWQCGKCKAVNG
jgi:hypothetical protein